MSEAADSKCSLLGGSFSLQVQAFLAITCVATLAVKRMNEYPQRDWSIWSLDVSKQGFGSAIGHSSNLFIATLLSASKSADECEFYCVCYLTDVTIGTVLNVSLLSLTERVLLANTPLQSMFKFGDYGDPPSIATWLIQLIIWLAIIIITKLLLVVFLIFSFDYLNAAISFAFSFLVIYPKIELIVVMIMIPFVFNILAFWITDR